MLLERYYDDSLAQASYVIGCEQSRQAIVIDPNREIDRYLRAAAAHHLRIVAVTETHIHADFLSGSRELAARADARLLLSNHGGKAWSYRFASDSGARLLRDGDAIELGTVTLQVCHTPGHTPEHVAFLVTDTTSGPMPMGMVSGDFLFVGDVGRPDLLERAAKITGTMQGAARQLYASLARLADLPDYLQIWPGHGAGSACGKSLGAVPQSTLGYERLTNPAFHQKAEAAFVKWVLADQPEAPPYFAVMKRLNRDGPPPPRPPRHATRLEAPDVLRALDQGHWVVDVRGSSDFARLHVRGSINIPVASKSFPTYAGTVLTYDRPIVIVAKTEELARNAERLLGLIGLDQVQGWTIFDTMRQEIGEGRTNTVSVIDPQSLAARLERNGPRVIDVRGRSEWNEGHLPKATHVYLGDLAERIDDADRDETFVVHCASGTRSSIAASLLMARGFRDVANLVGGFDAWCRLGLPVEKDRRSS